MARDDNWIGDRAEETPSSAWIYRDLNDQWVSAYRIIEQDGALVVAEIRVFPSEAACDPRRVESGPRDDPALERAPGGWSEDPTSVPVGGISARLLRAG